MQCRIMLYFRENNLLNLQLFLIWINVFETLYSKFLFVLNAKIRHKSYFYFNLFLTKLLTDIWLFLFRHSRQKRMYSVQFRHSFCADGCSISIQFFSFLDWNAATVVYVDQVGVGGLKYLMAYSCMYSTTWVTFLLMISALESS